MGWSTRQLAELAGTTLRTIRHYHDVGLLTEPERRANGYKSYGVQHLVRVLRIKRLTDLGLSLTQIAELGDADEHPGQALRLLDAELAGTIERLQRVRAELALILTQAAPTDLPPVVAKAIADADLSPADRSLPWCWRRCSRRRPWSVFAVVGGVRAGSGDRGVRQPAGGRGRAEASRVG